MAGMHGRGVLSVLIGLALTPFWLAAQGWPPQLDLVSPLQGVVMDESTGEVRTDATVTLVGTGLSTHTDAFGAFAFSAPPFGRVSVRASAPALVSMVEEVEVREGTIVHLQFLLPPVSSLLAEFMVPDMVPERGVVVEGVGGATAADLVARQVPGLFPATSVGDGDRGIRLRGHNTFQQPGDPYLFVNGARVSGTPTIYDALLQIPAEDVDRVEILRGPAAAFLHQFAANGVIHIYTKSRSAPPER